MIEVRIGGKILTYIYLAYNSLCESYKNRVYMEVFHHKNLSYTHIVINGNCISHLYLNLLYVVHDRNIYKLSSKCT